MSHPVELPKLAETIQRYRFAYLMTTSAEGAPRAVAVHAVPQAGKLVIRSVGRRTRENLLVRPVVGLVWPPAAEKEYSLIVDGTAAVAGDGVEITPTRAVLHRPAPAPHAGAGSGCSADCITVDTGSAARQAQA